MLCSSVLTHDKMLSVQIGRKRPFNGQDLIIVMNNTTLFTVCYNLKASSFIQRGTLILAGLKPLSSNSDLPRAARGEPVTAGIKRQLQKVAGSFQLVHYTKSPVLLLTLIPTNLISKYIKHIPTYPSGMHLGAPAPMSQTSCLLMKAFWQVALVKTSESSRQQHRRDYCSVSFGFQCGDFRW